MDHCLAPVGAAEHLVPRPPLAEFGAALVERFHELLERRVAHMRRVVCPEARERLEHVGRRAHVAPLLEPRVPGGANAGESGPLLTTEPRRAPTSAARQA